MPKIVVLAAAIGAAVITWPFQANAAGTVPVSPPAPTISPAIDGVLRAFQDKPIVAIGDSHGMAQEEDFYAALIRDPRFAREVGNVVVEFGGAARQETLDRYLAGEDVPYAELRRVWTDVVGWLPTVARVGYVNFYAQVRAVNAKLPPEQRIRVWLGEPEIDWTKVKSHDDVSAISGRRDTKPAEIINDQILGKKKKALVIYGGGHFVPAPLGRFVTLKEGVERVHPNSFFVVTAYDGFNETACAAVFEKAIQGWPSPALAAPVRGTTLQRDLTRAGCTHGMTKGLRFPPNMKPEDTAAILKTVEDLSSGVSGDALLYLGPSATLMWSAFMPDLYVDEDYRKEILRQFELKGVRPGPEMAIESFRMAPRPIRP